MFYLLFQIFLLFLMKLFCILFQTSANSLPGNTEVNITQIRLNQNSTNLFLQDVKSTNQTFIKNFRFCFSKNDNQTFLNFNGSFAQGQKRRRCKHPTPGSSLCPDGYYCVNLCRCQCECPAFAPSICCPPSMQCDANNNPIYYTGLKRVIFKG